MSADFPPATSAVADVTPDWPLSYLQTYGPRANPATALTWGLMGISLAVIVIITALVAIGILLKRRAIVDGVESPTAHSGPSGLAWIYVGMGLTTVALVVSLVWTVAVVAEISSPAGRPALTLEVTGYQWWWQVRYLGARPDQTFVTANEIHIPVGQPVLLRIMSADVIHSFWVPALTGKTDTVPGRTNIAWLQADRPGVYRGQCTEYCGVQHAHMALYVVADPAPAFDAWRQEQLRPAAAPASAGEAVFQAHCSKCHTVRGTPAKGAGGPDLTHLMSRRTIASGTLPNDGATLAGWISNPQALKPGSTMPVSNLTGPELNTVSAYLETLR